MLVLAQIPLAVATKHKQPTYNQEDNSVNIFHHACVCVCVCVCFLQWTQYAFLVALANTTILHTAQFSFATELA